MKATLADVVQYQDALDLLKIAYEQLLEAEIWNDIELLHRAARFEAQAFELAGKRAELQ